MRVIYACFMLLLITISSYSQTNTFPSTGNVGIGTTSPGFELDVAVGSIRIQSGSLYLRNNGAIYGLDNTGQYRILWLAGGDNSFAMSSMGGGYNFYNRELHDVLFRIHEDGNVGIGTFHTNGNKLAVEGTIAARKMKVTQAAWADYVFNNDYPLMSLEQVEAYVKANKHLPDVPSEEEVIAKGLDLGESQAVLLKKIEELTLYVIEQNKKIKKQDKTIASQSDQLNQQTERLAAIEQMVKNLQQQLKN